MKTEQPVRALGLGALVFALALSLAACDGDATPKSTTGAIEGVVTRPGPRPSETDLYLHVAGCAAWTERWGGEEKPRDESWWVNDDAAHTVPNVFVWAVEGPYDAADYAGQKMPAVLAAIDQHYFVPHVLGVVRNQDLRLVNNDESRFEMNVPMGPDTPPRDVIIEPGRSTVFSFPATLDHLSVVPQRHDWLRLWVFVLDHPHYGASDGSGRFSIEGLPPGQYRFKVWHERFGESEFTATVAAGQTLRHDVTFGAE